MSTRTDLFTPADICDGYPNNYLSTPNPKLTRERFLDALDFTSSGDGLFDFLARELLSPEHTLEEAYADCTKVLADMEALMEYILKEQKKLDAKPPA